MRSAGAGAAGATSSWSTRTPNRVDLRPRPDAKEWPSTILVPPGPSRLTDRARPDGPAWAMWAPVRGPANPKRAARSERAILTVQGSGSLVVYGAALRYGMLGEPGPN